MITLNQRSLTNLQGVRPELVRVVKRAAELYDGEGFVVTEGVRSLARQRELVASGASKTMQSYHLDARAVDIYPVIAGRVDVNAPMAEFRRIASAMQEAAAEVGVRITWGGGWKTFVDAPHYQLEGAI
jgi:peptidoglycan L-alanyl-D-glutamate endopeptidase CwlK